MPSMINVHTRENLDTEDQINEIQDTKIENDDQKYEADMMEQMDRLIMMERERVLK